MLKYKLIKMRAIFSFVFIIEGNVHETCAIPLFHAATVGCGR